MSAKYDEIGKGYNTTRKADPYLVRQLVKHLRPEQNKVYLDIGCGTGNYTSALQRLGHDFIGIDPSQQMLEKAKVLNHNISWKLGTAEQTGLEKYSVDGIIGTLTMHHWSSLIKGFNELYRVLRPAGRIVLFTATPEQMKGYWLNHYFPVMLEDSIVQMPDYEEIEHAMTQAGFSIDCIEPYHIQPDLQDKFLYCGKQNPEMYFDPNIRHGISSFSSLSNSVEVQEGLNKLRCDIDSGKIVTVMADYANSLGDYLYILGSKT